jgi:hypothetical protein
MGAGEVAEGEGGTAGCGTQVCEVLAEIELLLSECFWGYSGVMTI